MMVTLHKHCSFDIVDTSYSSLIDSNTSRRPPLLIMMLSTYYLSKQLIDLHVSIYKAARYKYSELGASGNTTSSIKYLIHKACAGLIQRSN